MFDYIKMFVWVFFIVFISKYSNCAPVVGRAFILVPIRDGQGESEFSPGTRQGIIANWIQNSQVFPVEVNVPDLISNATSGIQSIGQNFGQGLQTFGQNVGQNYQNWISNLGQRFPIINRIPFINGFQNNQNKPQKYLVLVPLQQQQQEQTLSGFGESGEMFTYP